MAFKLDTVEGSSARRTADGWEFRRGGIVTDVFGTGDAKLRNATEQAGVPQLGDAHPTIPNAKLHAIDPQPIGGDDVRLTLIYREQANQIEVGASAVQKQVNTDRLGNRLIVSHGSDEKAVEASKLVPETTLRITRQESVSPGDTAKEYVGTVNAAGWDVDPTSAQGEWLCTGIVGRSRDGGGTYTTDYEFQFDPDTWVTTVVYLNPETGNLYSDWVDTEDVRQYELYDIKDFDLLGLG